MVPRQQVIDYISSNIKSGYDLPSIRSRLIASGYDASEVYAAIEVVRDGKTTIGPRTHGSMFVLVAIAFIGFLLIGGTALVFFKQTGESPITSNNGGTSFEKPSSVTKPINNPSSTKPSSTTSTTPKSSDGTSANSGSTNFQSSQNVRDTLPTVDYNSGATTTITTRLAIENKVNQLAASRPDEAAALCSQINTIAGQQSCLNSVAQASEKSKYCTQISDVDSADACLTSLALKQAEDINLCKLMTSEIRVRQCALLYDSQSQLDTVQKAATTVQAPALAEKSVELTDGQIVESYNQNLDDMVVDTSSTTTQVTETTTQTTTETSSSTTSDALTDAPLEEPVQ